MKVVYEERLKLGLVLKIVIGFVFGVLLIQMTIFAVIGRMEGVYILILTVVFVAALFFAIIPRRYQILEDRLKIICGLLRITIPFDEIRSLELKPSYHIYGSFQALRFGTGTGEKVIVIRRRRGLSILIQPMDTRRFLSELRKVFQF